MFSNTTKQLQTERISTTLKCGGNTRNLSVYLLSRSGTV